MSWNQQKRKVTSLFFTKYQKQLMMEKHLLRSFAKTLMISLWLQETDFYKANFSEGKNINLINGKVKKHKAFVLGLFSIHVLPGWLWICTSNFFFFYHAFFFTLTLFIYLFIYLFTYLFVVVFFKVYLHITLQ